MCFKHSLVFAALSTTVGLLIGCSPALYKPDPEITYGAPHGQLLEGRKLYVSACGSCHQLHLPNQYSTEVWAHNLDEMQVRAKITNEQKELILTYLKNAPAQIKSSDK